jgi:hypothetical protein
MCEYRVAIVDSACTRGTYQHDSVFSNMTPVAQLMIRTLVGADNTAVRP